MIHHVRHVVGAQCRPRAELDRTPSLVSPNLSTPAGESSYGHYQHGAPNRLDTELTSRIIVLVSLVHGFLELGPIQYTVDV